MEEGNFKERMRAVKLAEMKVKNVKKAFTAQNVTDMQLDDFRNRLKQIRDHLDCYNEKVSELLLDLDADNPDDQQRITTLEEGQERLLQEVLQNEKEVEAKVRELLPSKPLTRAEENEISLKTKQMNLENEKEQKLQEEKLKKIEVDKNEILHKVATLNTKVSLVKELEKLSDQQVREFLHESKTWETKLEDIRAAKVKMDKELISVGSSGEDDAQVKEAVNEISTLLDDKIKELKKIDSDRALFSLSKTVKEPAPYPPPFAGVRGENVHKFCAKMVEAITANQIREKDKVDVLKKHLRGAAKARIGDYQKTMVLHQ